MSSNVVVCDNGTGFVKCGWSGENFPRHVFPSMVGRPILRAEEQQDDALKLDDIMFGQEAADVRAHLECNYPVENGIIKDWDDMERVRGVLGVLASLPRCLVAPMLLVA